MAAWRDVMWDGWGCAGALVGIVVVIVIVSTCLWLCLCLCLCAIVSGEWSRCIECVELNSSDSEYVHTD